MVITDFLKHIEHDTRSTTGNNLRSILLLTNKTNIEDLKIKDRNCVEHHPVRENKWRINLITEIIDIQNRQMSADGMSLEELKEILHYLCVN